MRKQVNHSIKRIKRKQASLLSVLGSIIILILLTALPALAQAQNEAINVPVAQAGTGPSMAPLNPDFTEYLQGLNTGNVQKQTSGGYALGYRPAPLDLSCLKGKAVLSAASYPASYDLRATGKLTPVKDQNSCGSCWAFATCASLESNLLPVETFDFSENNLKNTHGFDVEPCSGGNFLMSTACLTRWSGPVSEADDPYNPYSGTSPTGLSAQKHIQQVYFLPDRGGPLDNSNIKQAIMEYGGIHSSIYWGDIYYNESNYAYYYNGNEGLNHDVTIVGWDDNFDRNKFLTTPPGNGAFIIKNSWGTSFGESGYFYISYYDSMAGSDNAVFYNAEATTNYQDIYQYDPLGLVGSCGYDNSTAWAANIFTAASNRPLAAVSTYALVPDTAYEIYIYKDVASGPKSGSLAGSKTGTLPLPGYHTISLDTPVPLDSGQKFSIVIKITTPGWIYPIPAEYAVTKYSSSATSNSGESWVSDDSSAWEDLYSDTANVCLKAFTTSSLPGVYAVSGQVTAGGTGLAGVTMTFTEVDGSGNTPAEVTSDAGGNWSQTGFQSGSTYKVTPTRAGYTFTPESIDFGGGSTSLNFTGAQVESQVRIISVTPDQINLSAGGTQQLSVAVSPADATVTYASNDEETAEVSDTGLVSALKTGNTIITISAAKPGCTPASVNVPVAVSEAKVTGIAGSLTWQVAPGSADMPQAEVSLWTTGADRSTAVPVLTQNIDVTVSDNNGAFQLTGLEPGVYDITFKFPYSLRALNPNVTITQDVMTPVNFGEITLGDTWGEEGPDNVIDVSDYSAILYSFGTEPGDEKYIDTCDLNRDGVVDVYDYSIVLYNFGKCGEAPL